MLKIASWNVNSILARMQNLLDWLAISKPDVVLLQEIRCTNGDFPKEYLENLGYNIAINGEKGRNGVAILSKYPLEETVATALPNCPLRPEQETPEARYLEVIISADVCPLRIASLYAPNGGDSSLDENDKIAVRDSEKFHYKMAYFGALYQHLANLIQLDECYLLGGDFNICPELLDMYSTKLDGEVCCNLLERQQFRALQNLGYTDVFRALNPHMQEFTWWSYRHNAWEKNQGFRIDHFLASPMTMDRMVNCTVEAKITRSEKKPSDHAPIVCQVNC